MGKQQFHLEVNGVRLSTGPRGDLIDFVESYYVRRAGYTFVALNTWNLIVGGVVTVIVRLVYAGGSDG